MKTNRDYLSHSQYALFKQSPKAFYEKYVEGKTDRPTKYQWFGKELMEGIEFEEEEDGVPKELKRLAKLGRPEIELTVNSLTIGTQLFGIVDILQKDETHFYEIKTGKHPWTKAKVFKDTQMLFYALMLFIKNKEVPTAELVWAETRDTEDGGVEFTGSVVKYKREFTLRELRDFQLELRDTVIEISEYVHSVVDIDKTKDERLLELMTEKKRIDEELDLLKSEIMVEIKEFGDKYADSENFKITLAKRKVWTYSDELKDIDKEHKEKLKLLKASEEKNGTATMKTTEYLLIKGKK